MYDKALGQAGGDSLRVDLAVLHHIPLLGLSLRFLTLLRFTIPSLLVFLISKRQREGRDKGERIDTEECHLLCALFFLSLPLLHSSLFYSFLGSSH